MRTLLVAAAVAASAGWGSAADPARKTAVSIDGKKFLINGQPTYKGRVWNGHSVEGLLFNARMVQATFDDRNPATVRRTRQVEGYRPMPVLLNEDDHFDFDKPKNNFAAAVGEYASWGYFDYRTTGEGFDAGYQSVPVNWKTSTDRKKGFFKLPSAITNP